MKYENHISLESAKSALKLLKSKGYNAYLMTLNAKRHQVRYW